MQYLIYLNELSLHNQYQNLSEFEDAIKQMLKKFAKIKDYSNKIKLYKSNLILSTVVLKQQVFQTVFYQKLNKELQHQFNKELLQNSIIINWHTEYLQSEDFTYIEIQINEDVSGYSLAECYEQKLSNNDVAAINFIKSKYSLLDNFIITKDNTEEIKAINTLLNLDSYLNSIPQRRDYLVQDSTKFQKVANCICTKLGQPVYQHISKRTYWVFDDSHNTDNFHYEVYDKRKQHIGEASENGEIDTSKAENRKLYCK